MLSRSWSPTKVSFAPSPTTVRVSSLLVEWMLPLFAPPGASLALSCQEVMNLPPVRSETAENWSSSVLDVMTNSLELPSMLTD
jgi:hypothetical protein